MLISSSETFQRIFQEAWSEKHMRNIPIAGQLIARFLIEFVASVGIAVWRNGRFGNVAVLVEVLPRHLLAFGDYRVNFLARHRPRHLRCLYEVLLQPQGFVLLDWLECFNMHIEAVFINFNDIMHAIIRRVIVDNSKWYYMHGWSVNPD